MSRRFLRFTKLGLLLALGFTLTASAAFGPLRLKPKKGQVYRYEMVARQEMDMDLGPLGTQAMETTMTMMTSQTIREVRDDGSVLVEMEYEDVTMEISDAVGMFGDGAAGPDLNEFFVGQVFQLEFSDRGEILSVAGFSALFDDMMKDVAANAPQLQSMLGQTFSDDAMKLMLQQAIPVFPEEMPAQGAKWTRETEMANPIVGNLKMSAAYIHQGVERRSGRKCVRLDLQVAMGTGSLWTDRKSGMLVESVMNQRFDMEISMTTSTDDDASPPTTMDFKIGIGQEIRTTLLD